jgi:hypothetical protein
MCHVEMHKISTWNRAALGMQAQNKVGAEFGSQMWDLNFHNSLFQGP